MAGAGVAAQIAGTIPARVHEHHHHHHHHVHGADAKVFKGAVKKGK